MVNVTPFLYAHLKDTGIAFDTATRDELWALTQGHPYKLQRAAHHRYEAASNPASRFACQVANEMWCLCGDTKEDLTSADRLWESLHANRSQARPRASPQSPALVVEPAGLPATVVLGLFLPQAIRWYIKQFGTEQHADDGRHALHIVLRRDPQRNLMLQGFILLISVLAIEGVLIQALGLPWSWFAMVLGVAFGVEISLLRGVDGDVAGGVAGGVASARGWRGVQRRGWRGGSIVGGAAGGVAFGVLDGVAGGVARHVPRAVVGGIGVGVGLVVVFDILGLGGLRFGIAGSVARVASVWQSLQPSSVHSALCSRCHLRSAYRALGMDVGCGRARAGCRCHACRHSYKRGRASTGIRP